MAKIISIHSFRGGTGKSNTTANVTTLLAAEGRRVGVVDTDIQSPGIHVLFRHRRDDHCPLAQRLPVGKCAIQDTPWTSPPASGAPIKGQIFLIPSSIKAGEIAASCAKATTSACSTTASRASSTPSTWTSS